MVRDDSEASMHVVARPTVAPQRVQEDSQEYRVVTPLMTVDVICHAKPATSKMGPDSVRVVRSNK